MSDVAMPRLSDTMEEGTILRWLKHDGERVRRGEELVEIETDKASMTYESDRDGVLQTVAREGDTLAVGETIAHVGERPAALAGPPPLGNGAPPEREATAGERVKASPLARRVAREAGVDLRTLAGSGPGGRIVKADVEASAATATRMPSAAPTIATTAPPPSGAPPIAPAAPSVRDLAGAKGETTVVELSRTQRTIARRMAESKATIPDFTLRADVDIQRCVELRAELKRLAQPAETGASPAGADRAGAGQASADGQTRVPTYNDMVVKACALALREHPRANGSYRDGRFELHSRVNVGVAVAIDAEDPLRSALVVPTLLDADLKSLGEIARETRALAGRVRDGTITPPELSGATFTVSNLGMYGIRDFTAIVNPPQAAILAVGAVEPRAVVHDGQIAARQEMSVTLSCDHRILYGADAALFLARVRELLEEPAALTL